MILFYISEALNSLKNAKISSIITVITISIAITFCVLSFLLVSLSNRIENRLKSRIEINLFLDEALTDKEISSLQKELIRKEFVYSVKFVSKEEAVKKFIAETGEDFSSILDVNPLPASFVIRLKSNLLTREKVDRLTQEFGKLKGVDDVVYDYSLTLKILNFINSLKGIIYLISLFLILVAVYLVYSTNLLVIQSKMKQLMSMKLVGAKLTAIKIPIYFNGVILGLIAAVFCIAGFNAIIFILTKTYFNVRFIQLFYIVEVLIFIFGFFFGLIGSVFAARRITWKVDLA